MSAGAWTVVGALIALAGTIAVAVGGVITARGSRKASPYDSLAERVLKLETQHDEDVLQREKDRVAISSLERRLSVVIEDRDALVRYFSQLRDWVAVGAPPPAPPVPSHLHKVIPDWTPADEDARP